MGAVWPFRAPAELHADGDGDRGAHSLHVVCAHRCRTAAAAAGEAALRRAATVTEEPAAIRCGVHLHVRLADLFPPPPPLLFCAGTYDLEEPSAHFT